MAVATAGTGQAGALVSRDAPHRPKVSMNEGLHVPVLDRGQSKSSRAISSVRAHLPMLLPCSNVKTDVGRKSILNSECSVCTHV